MKNHIMKGGLSICRTRSKHLRELLLPLQRFYEMEEPARLPKQQLEVHYRKHLLGRKNSLCCKHMVQGSRDALHFFFVFSQFIKTNQIENRM